MILEYKKKAFWTFGVWVALWTMFFLFLYAIPDIPTFGDIKYGVSLVCYFLSIITFFVLLYYLAKGKGYPGWYAAAGLIFVIGFLLIAALKDKFPEEK